MKIPEYLFQRGKRGNSAVYYINGKELRVCDVVELQLNFGLSFESVFAMPLYPDIDCWLKKLYWLRDRYQRKDDGSIFTRFDVCKRLYGLSYDEVVAFSPKEFFGDSFSSSDADCFFRKVNDIFMNEVRSGDYTHVRYAKEKYSTRKLSHDVSSDALDISEFPIPPSLP